MMLGAVLAVAVAFVTPETLSEADAFVVQDVKGLLARASGSGLDGVTLHYGLRPEGVELTPLQDQEHCTYVQGKDVYLFGGGVNGSRYAAYDFLRTLGYRFFDQRGGVRVPDLDRVTLTDGLRRRRPSFAIRSAIRGGGRYTGRESALFALRIGYNGPAGMLTAAGVPSVPDYETPVPWAHSLPVFLPRSPNASDAGRAFKWIHEMCGNLEKEHPDYFSKNQDGTPNFNHQRCFSAPGCKELFRKVFFAHLDSEYVKSFKTAKKYVYIDCTDTAGRFCWCADCRKLDEKYGYKSGPLLDLILELAPEVAQKYPDVMLCFDAYRKDQTQHPPTNLKVPLPKNVYVRLCPIDDDFSKDMTHPHNQETYRDLQAWTRLAEGRVLVWYYPNPYGPRFPYSGIHRLVTDLKLYHACGIEGFDTEHNVGVGIRGGFSELQLYLLYSLYNDMSLDVDTLIDEFLDYEYGAAARGVRLYLDELDDLLQKTEHQAFPWNAGPCHCRYLTRERLDRWEAAFDAMAEKVKDDQPRLRNLNRQRLYLDMAAIRVGKDPGPIARVRQIVSEIAEDCYSNHYRPAAKEMVAEYERMLFFQEIELGGKSTPLPEAIFGAYPKDRIFQTMAESRSGGYTNDTRAAFGKAAYYNGNSRPETLKLPLWSAIQVMGGQYFGNIAKIDKAQLPPEGEYRFFDLGEIDLPQNSLLFIGSYWLNANVSGAYVEGSVNHSRLFASLRFEGPFYYAGDTRANAIICDRVVVVRLDKE